MDLELRTKRALITGGSRGIGLAIARQLAAEGADVAVCARNESGISTAIAGLDSFGVRTFGAVCDVTDPRSLERFVRDAADRLGGLDIVVANAGGAVGGGLAESTHDDWVKTFERNVIHAADVIRSAAPFLQASGAGCALIIGLISGWKPAPKSQYGAAKAAEIYLAQSLAHELAPGRVRVNVLSPGSTLVEGGAWDRYRAQDPSAFEEFVTENLPAGRLAKPEEIAYVAAFLCSAKASWINGAHIPVDGAQGIASVLR